MVTKRELEAMIEEMVSAAEADARAGYYRVIEAAYECKEISEDLQNRIDRVFSKNIQEELNHSKDAAEILEEMSGNKPTAE